MAGRACAAARLDGEACAADLSKMACLRVEEYNSSEREGWHVHICRNHYGKWQYSSLRRGELLPVDMALSNRKAWMVKHIGITEAAAAAAHCVVCWVPPEKKRKHDGGGQAADTVAQPKRKHSRVPKQPTQPKQPKQPKQPTPTVQAELPVSMPSNPRCLSLGCLSLLCLNCLSEPLVCASLLLAYAGGRFRGGAG